MKPKPPVLPFGCYFQVPWFHGSMVPTLGGQFLTVKEVNLFMTRHVLFFQNLQRIYAIYHEHALGWVNYDSTLTMNTFQVLELDVLAFHFKDEQL